MAGHGSGIAGRTALLGVVLLAVLAFGALAGCAPEESDDATDDSDASQPAEPAAPATEIVVQGQGATVRIEPSVDDVVSGVITITIVDAPEGTQLGFFAMRKQGSGEMFEDGPNIGIDTDGTDGWSSLLDTTAFENGVYEVSGLAMPDSDSDPLGAATAQVIFEN